MAHVRCSDSLWPLEENIGITNVNVFGYLQTVNLK